MTGGGICAHPPSIPTRFACAENGVGVKQIPQTNFPGRIPVVCVPNPRLWFASAYSSRVSVSSSCGVFQPRSRWDFLSDQNEEGAAGFPAGCDLSLGWMEVSLSLLPHTRPVLNPVFWAPRAGTVTAFCAALTENMEIFARYFPAASASSVIFPGFRSP